MPDNQQVPKGPSDWNLDALVTGEGTVIRTPIIDSKKPSFGDPRPRGDGGSHQESK